MLLPDRQFYWLITYQPYKLTLKTVVVDIIEIRYISLPNCIDTGNQCGQSLFEIPVSSQKRQSLSPGLCHWTIYHNVTLYAILCIVAHDIVKLAKRDILFTGIIAPNSVEGILNGNHYNRAVRIHNLCAEALERMRWKQFCNTVSPENDCQTRTLLDQFREKPSQQSFNSVKSNPKVTQLFRR